MLFAGKLPEMLVTPAQCWWVHIYGYSTWILWTKLDPDQNLLVLLEEVFHELNLEFNFSSANNFMINHDVALQIAVQENTFAV